MQPPPNDYVKQYGSPAGYAPPPYGAQYPQQPGGPGYLDIAAVSSCGSRSTVWGIMMIVAGALVCLGSLFIFVAGGSRMMGGRMPAGFAFIGGLVYLAMGTSQIVIGVCYTKAGSALRNTAASGGDQTQLSEGMRSMGTALLIQIIIFLVVVVLTMAVFVLALSQKMRF